MFKDIEKLLDGTAPQKDDLKVKARLAQMREPTFVLDSDATAESFRGGCPVCREPVTSDILRDIHAANPLCERRCLS